MAASDPPQVGGLPNASAASDTDCLLCGGPRLPFLSSEGEDKSRAINWTVLREDVFADKRPLDFWRAPSGIYVSHLKSFLPLLLIPGYLPKSMPLADVVVCSAPLDVRKGIGQAPVPCAQCPPAYRYFDDLTSYIGGPCPCSLELQDQVLRCLSCLGVQHLGLHARRRTIQPFPRVIGGRSSSYIHIIIKYT